MSQEERITEELKNKFPFLEGNISIPRPRRISLEVAYSNFNEVFEYALTQFKFSHLCTITGLDEQDKLGFVYHLAGDSGIILNLKTSVQKENPVIKTVREYFPGAEIYERELMDLLGAKVEGLPPGSRYPLPDDWPTDQFPLRKDWKPKTSAGGIKDA